MKNNETQQSIMEKHYIAMRTTAAFSGLELSTVVAEFEKRIHG